MEKEPKKLTYEELEYKKVILEGDLEDCKDELSNFKANYYCLKSAFESLVKGVLLKKYSRRELSAKIEKIATENLGRSLKDLTDDDIVVISRFLFELEGFTEKVYVGGAISVDTKEIDKIYAYLFLKKKATLPELVLNLHKDREIIESVLEYLSEKGDIKYTEEGVCLVV